jgi:hypothetical protein
LDSFILFSVLVHMDKRMSKGRDEVNLRGIKMIVASLSPSPKKQALPAAHLGPPAQENPISPCLRGQTRSKSISYPGK